MIDAYASTENYYDHLAPIWAALDESERGTFWVASRILAEKVGASVTLGQPRTPGPAVLIAGYHDLTQVERSRPLVYLEHGAGQTYLDRPRHPSYSGGAGRERVTLFLTLNETTADRERAAYPETPVAVVGSPRLDALDDALTDRPPEKPVTIAYCPHWDCNIVPETRWSFPDWRAQLATLPARWTMLGSGHPRGVMGLAHWYDRQGFELVTDFAEVCARADVVLTDNSSAGPEFAAVTDRPVVWLNSARYRKGIAHGGRFWDWPQGQVMLDPGEDLVAGIEVALSEPVEHYCARQAMVERVYPTRGDGARLAVDAIREAGLC